MYDSRAPLAIIAGGGDLPQLILLARSAEAQKNLILAIEDNTPKALAESAPHVWFRIGALGAAMQHLQEQGISQIVMAGYIKRPKLSHIIPDAKGAALLKRLGVKLFSGDNRLLDIISQFFEEHGFTIVGAHEICKSHVATLGAMTKHVPHDAAMQDITLGRQVLQALSPYDIGQAVVVQNGHVLGIEAIEGTEALLNRVASFLDKEQSSVLVKAPKQGQILHVDMPVIGRDTVTLCQKIGIKGIAVGADATLLLGKEAVIADANSFNIFIYGFNVLSDV
jgi:UDP-2,3-diacylglucosamine hydrolase